MKVLRKHFIKRRKHQNVIHEICIVCLCTIINVCKYLLRISSFKSDTEC